MAQTALAAPDVPPNKIFRYRGVEDSVRQMRANVLGPRGAWSPRVRLEAERIVHFVSPKDYLSECLAIRYWVNFHVPYMRDPTHVEWIRDPEALLEQIYKAPDAKVRADCDECAQLIAALWLALGNKAEFITAGFRPPPSPHTHVFTRCLIPKTDNLWMVTDPVAGTKETSMLTRIKSWDKVTLE